MNVFIFGGSKQTYLAKQVELLRTNITDLDQTIFVSGPIARHPKAAASTEHIVPDVDIPTIRIDSSSVRSGGKLFRYRRLIEYLPQHYFGDQLGLMIHGDLFPVATMSAKVLLDGSPAAWSGGFAPKWTLTTKEFGGKQIHLSNARKWSFNPLQLGQFKCQHFLPGWVHLDNLESDNAATMTAKLEELEKWLVTAAGA